MATALSEKDTLTIRIFLEQLTGGFIGPFSVSRIESSFFSSIWNGNSAYYTITGLGGKPIIEGFKIGNLSLAEEIADVLNTICGYKI